MDSNSGQTASIWMALAEETESAPLSENMHIDVYEYIKRIHS